MIRERLRNGISGIPLILVAILLLVGVIWLFFTGAGAAERNDQPAAALTIFTSFVLFGVWILLLRGFFIVAPNEAKVLQLFGSYVGTAKQPGPAVGEPLLHEKEDLAPRA